MMRLTVALLLLAGCVETVNPTGCPNLISEAGRRMQAACEQAYYEERARQSGGVITRCFGGDGQATCVTE